MGVYICNHLAWWMFNLKQVLFSSDCHFNTSDTKFNCIKVLLLLSGNIILISSWLRFRSWLTVKVNQWALYSLSSVSFSVEEQTWGVHTVKKIMNNSYGTWFYDGPAANYSCFRRSWWNQGFKTCFILFKVTWNGLNIKKLKFILRKLETGLSLAVYKFCFYL